MTSNRHLRMRARAHKLIVRNGQPAMLRRSAGDRACFVLEDAFSPRDIDGERIQKTDRRFLMSALSANDSDSLVEVSPPPDAHEDDLIIPDPVEDSSVIELRLASPPGRLAPGGIVIYYELHCRNK